MIRILHTPFLLAICLFGCFGCNNGSYRELSDFGGYRSRNGTLEAKSDIQKGTPSIKAYGLPHPATEQYIVLLKKKLNIEYDSIAGCSVDSFLVKYADSYNKVIFEYAAKRYGPSAIDDVWKQAFREYEIKHKNG